MRIPVAQGDCLAFFSGDDLWTPNRLALQAAALADTPETQCVFGMLGFFLAEGRALVHTFRPGILNHPTAARQFEWFSARR